MMTMELSTSMPMPSASPPRESMFRVRPAKYMAMMVITKDRGMDTPMISVVGMLRRNRNRMPMASRPPISAVCQTLAMAWLMKLEGANTSTSLMSAGSDCRSLARRSLTRAAICTVLVPDCFCRRRMMVGLRSSSTSVSSSTSPLYTAATSSRRMVRPPEPPTTTPRISSGELNLPSVRREYLRAPSTTEPPVTFRFSARSRPTTRSMVRP